jgi:hypothetical protein
MRGIIKMMRPGPTLTTYRGAFEMASVEVLKDDA